MPKFDFNDIVSITKDSHARRGQCAWIVGISEDGERRGAYLLQFPTGTVYTIEFEDGSSTDVHEVDLSPAS